MDKKQEKIVRKFGLIGKDIDYSFSRTYFKNKFESEKIEHCSYVNFDISSIVAFPEIFENNKNIAGLNVTIPYKQAVIPYLDKVSKQAKKIGAVNTIKITKKGRLIGYNTDCYGFINSIKPFLKSHHKKALILGTGGASKAIAYGLKKLDIDYKFVSRKKHNKERYLQYYEVTKDIISEHKVLINCTPLGTFPNTNACPDIPYDGISKDHLLFDLIYNPEETKFLTLGKLKEASICNGLRMLELQAEKAWEIWN